MSVARVPLSYSDGRQFIQNTQDEWNAHVNQAISSGNFSNQPLSDNSASSLFAINPYADIRYIYQLEKALADANNQFSQQSADTAWNRTVAENALNREFQQQSAQEAMNFSASEAEKQREWQEYMANTEYQRAVADARKAGINPMLIAQQGGASTPSGAVGSGFSASGSTGSAPSATGTKANVDYGAISSYITASINKAASVYATNVNALTKLLSSILG